MSGATAKRPAGGKPARKGGSRGGRGAARVVASRPWWRRPVAILAILAGLFIGLPLAQALFGDLGALLLACIVAGFALGRATA
ncbi:tricarboxylate carrier family protein [Roseomonas sp. OT10]|uniref:tricarboxylate carrier family protein n=1 Tax=Roseomonas cutis TaxID=2897332 RepID=UPI001E300DE7|nr:tricarboxylate carrier family protein [Roseomonas sp. OT10]UFN50547.1 tricarboxylate carrier family protein [Roseomonas sp. OT10]